MIFEQIISLGVSVLTYLLTFLPETNIDTLNFITSGVTDFRSRLTQADWLFPVNTFLFILTIFFAIELIILVFKIIKFLVPKPFGAGHS